MATNDLGINTNSPIFLATPAQPQQVSNTAVASAHVDVPSVPTTVDKTKNDKQQVQKVADDLNSYAQDLGRAIHFSIDNDNGETVIKVMDNDSGKLIRQIPSEDLLAIRKSMEKATAAIFDKKV